MIGRLARSTFGFMLSVAAITFSNPAPAAENVKIGDLSKAGYTCKEVGEARHLCTRDKTDPTYGCEQHECKVLSRRIGGGELRAPVGGVVRR